jgi:hypothetical protein
LTGTTVGCGDDPQPTSVISSLLTIVVAIFGITSTGIIETAAIEAEKFVGAGQEMTPAKF